MKRIRMLGLVVAGLLAAGSAMAQPYPTQRVTIVVPFSAGSNTDGQARIIADKLTDLWHQPVIVENRPGLPGSAAVAKATPDGYTLMLTSSGHTVIDVLNKSLNFDPIKDFTGVNADDPVTRRSSRAACAAGKERHRAHCACETTARHTEFCVGRHRQHVVSRRRSVQADRQDRHRPHSLQRRTRSDDLRHP